MFAITGWRAVGITSAAAVALRYLYLSSSTVYFSTNSASMSAATPEDEQPTNMDWKSAKSVYDFTVKDISGNDVPMSKYEGHVLLIVNVASQCGLTATNYKELQELQEKYGESKGLKILAFPCNQFGGQEPGNNEEIVCFAKKRNATFDFFDKIDVNGKNTHPLWSFLKHKQGGTLGSFIKWNFTKFIVDKNGIPVERHGPNTDPSKLAEKLEKYF
ncbi:probable phospholipid hydroperoxide glutathione peroxidase isoform X1 [Chrysoperla carnea]|uniref:probable phospholipid hydroperoxide glutathione peroxidase isoform X1 n=1 Tax=Chrysoperla carnea TaxID=189513 RepID=UPI001D05CBDB|nr:probable phospholipid hydroperoxide glutathione peroxidase isoform X1 [Chrysoperla carnea]